MATPEDDPIDDKPMPLIDHLIELRSRLMWALGAFVICFVGQVRSGRSTLICSENGRYLWIGMPEGCCVLFMSSPLLGSRWGLKSDSEIGRRARAPRGEGPA